MSANEICHEAKVTEVRPDSLLVKVVDSSDCGGCALFRFCNGNSELQLEVERKGEDEYCVGDTVRICASARSHISAMTLCILIPLAVLIVSVLICSAFGLEDVGAAAIGLSSVGIWFSGLYLLRRRLNGELLWTIVRG